MFGTQMAVGTWLSTSFDMPRVTVGSQDIEIKSWGSGVERATIVVHDQSDAVAATGTGLDLPSAAHAWASQVVSVTRWDVNGNKISCMPPHCARLWRMGWQDRGCSVSDGCCGVTDGCCGVTDGGCGVSDAGRSVSDGGCSVSDGDTRPSDTPPCDARRRWGMGGPPRGSSSKFQTRYPSPTPASPKDGVSTADRPPVLHPPAGACARDHDAADLRGRDGDCGGRGLRG